MKVNTYFLLVAITIGFVTTSFGQPRKYDINNGIGIGAGVTQFDITTDNFITKKESGFLGAMLANVDLPHRWYNMSFGMQLSENNISIAARPSSISTEEEFIKYKMFAAQIALMAHFKLIGSHFTIDAGPMLQYNGKLELKDKAKEGYIINNYDALSAMDITKISQFNFNGAVGASLGFKNFKLKGQYIHGFTNILKKLENQNYDTSGGDSRFKGNQSMLVFGAMFYF